MASLREVSSDPFAGAGSPLDRALEAEGVTGKLADVARSVYQQESSSGKNTKTSNAGARGGMQIIPATFNRNADKGWSIDDPDHNARAGVRYLKTLYDKAGGDPKLTAAGYYGGEGGLEKARKGIAVSDPRNPNAPTTLQYGEQVASRLPKDSGVKLREVDTDPFAQAPAKAATPQGEPYSLGKDLGRQIGLTARYGIEGVGSSLDFLASPIRAGLNLAGANIKPGGGETLANALNLPKPQTSTERVVGDASRFMAGSAVPLGAANKVAKTTTGATQAVASQMAMRPATQIISAGASGAADKLTGEMGGGEGARLAASLGAGIATPFVVDKVQNAAQSLGRTAQRMSTPAPLQAQVDIRIEQALNKNGINLADLPNDIKNGIRTDVSKALQTGGTLSDDAVRRLADYRLTNTTPTAATLSLDPAMVSQQKNLAKIGINSKDKAAQALGQVENSNNRQLIQTLNDAGAGTGVSPRAGGQTIMSALDNRNELAKSAIGARYDAARATGGRSAALDPSQFTNSANNLLDDALLGGKLPSDVRNLLNSAATGKMPLTVDTAEQLKTRIGDLQRSTNDMAERKALGLVRQALDETSLLPGQELGKESINAFNRARKLNRAWMGVVDKTPALQAVRDGIEPDKFVQQYVVGNGAKANVADVQALQRAIKSNPEALAAARSQIAAHLKDKALSGAADEVGNFSQSAFNKALNQIGDEKLALFFKPEDIQKLKAAGRVASYEQVQPKGSAVNNSNTAGASIAAVLDRIGSSPLLSKIPFGNALAEPITNISVGMQANKLMDASRALTKNNALAAPRRSLMIPPASFMGGQDD